MSSKKAYYLLIGLLAVLGCLGIGSIVWGNKVLTSSAHKLNDLKLQTSITDEQQNSLTRARQDIEKYEELETIAKTIVPQEKDQARTVREIVKFAQDTKVPVTNITFPASELGETPKTDNKSSDPASPLSQVTPVEGIKGVYQLQITIANDEDTPVSFSALVEFLKKLEQNRRTSQVTSVGLQPLATNRNLLTYTMTINVYIKP